MPRPKRTKVAPSAPDPRGRKPAHVEVEAIPHATREKSLHSDNASDADKEVVTNVQHVRKRNRSGKAPAKQEGLRRGAHMSEPADDQLETGRGAPEVEAEESLLQGIDLESSSPAVKVGRRDGSVTTLESSILAIGNFKRRPRQPSILGPGPARARSSSVESNMAEDNGLTSIGRRNASSLSIGNFKRRPRQPSILGRNVAPVRSSSAGLDVDQGTPDQVGSAFKIGNFKRRAREPSILRTGQKAQQARAEYDDEDEDDFNPEDESTPLNLSKTRTMTISSSASSSNPRKRKLSAVQMPESSPTLPSLHGSEEQEAIPATAPLGNESEEENGVPSSPPQAPISSIESRPVTPEPMSETMAPPQSSSPSAESPSESLPTQRYQAQTAPSRGRRTLRSRSRPLATQDSPISSPPSLTHSPNRLCRAGPKPRARRQPPPVDAFSTAQLQALLPRRRRQTTRDPFDIASSEDEVDVSGLASDDDELTNLSVRPATRRPNSLSIRRPAPLRKPAKSKAAPKPSSRSTGGKITYGSRANAMSDKENEEIDPDDSLAPLPDDVEVGEGTENSQELETRVGKELKRAARKFEEVDKWELDFEEVTASSSSPRDAR
jgi:hypothetical protein